MNRIGTPWGNALRHIVLCLGLVIVLAPFVWMISTSLKPANFSISSRTN